MNEKKIREALYYENHFIDFFQTLKPDVQKKVLWTIKLVESMMVPILQTESSYC